MRTLYQFPLSHYCEKARWLLDHKGLDYVAKNLVPGLHRPLVGWKTSKSTLPMLHDGKVWIADSTEIALYLDGQYPECPLLRREPEFRSAAIALDRLANELGIYVRRWMYIYLIDQPQTMDVMLGEGRVMNLLRPMIAPAFKQGVRRLYGIRDDKAAAAKQKIDDLLAQIEAQLLANGADADAGYLVSDQMGLADIAVCSLAAPLLGPAGTPWQPYDESDVPEPIAQFRQALFERPIGQYIWRIYQTERNARVDWHGQ